MGLLLKQFFTLLKLLNSETGTYQIAWGVAFGFVLGMAPVLSLQTVIILILAFLFRVQLGAVFGSAFFFQFVAFVLDPLFNWVGRMILSAKALEGIFTHLYNMPLVPLTRFNDSVVMGAGVASIIFMPVVFWMSVVFVRRYRKVVVERFKQTRFFKALQATALYQWYYKYDRIFGQS